MADNNTNGPSAEDLKRAQELEAIERRRRDLAREMQGMTASQAYTRDSVAQAASMTDYARMLTEQMKEQAGITRGQSEVDKSLLSLSRQLQTSVQQVTSELGNEYQVQKQLVKDKELQRKLQIEIANQENALSAARIANAAKVSNIQQSIATADRQSLQLKTQIEGREERIRQLQEQGLSSSNSQIKNIERELELLTERKEKFDSLVNLRTNDLDAAKQGITDEELKLSTLNNQLDTVLDIQGIRQAELQTQRNITKATGVTGAVVGGLGGIMQRLGMRSGIFNQAMDDSKAAMEEMAGEAIKAGKSVSKMSIAMKGFNILASAAADVLKDPVVIIGAIVDGFFDVNKAATEFTQLTGMASDKMAGVSTRISTTVDLLKQSANLTRELGFNAAAVFTPDQVGQISDIKTLLGLSEAAAGRLGLMMKSTGQPAEEIRDSISDTVSELNEAGNSAVAPRQVLDDVLTVSEDIAASLGNSPKALSAAATAARKFGMTLSQVDKIAGSLMEFESSIEAELEAQLLTGKNINLSKARELALNNDLEGVAKELANQGASAAEFASMNRIQQESLAKAMGMSRQELAKSVLTQEAMAGMTKQQIADARGVSLAESERIDIQERIQKSMQGLAQAFAPILEALVPIVEMLSSFIQPVAAFVGGIAKAIAAVIKFQPVMMTLKGLTIAAFGFKFASYIKGLMLSGKSMSDLVKTSARLNAIRKAQAAGKLNKGMIVTSKLTVGQTIAVKAHNAVLRAGIAIKKAYGATTDYVTKKVSALMNSEKLQAIQTKLSGIASSVATSIRKKSAAVYNLLTSSTVGQRVATVAGTVAEKAKLATEKVSALLSKTRIGQYLAERAAIVASTAAKWLGVGATTALNSAAATSATAGAAGGAGIASFAAGLTALTPAIPVMLAIGAALLLASPAIYAFGLAIKSAFDGIANIVTAVGGAIGLMLDKITLEKAAAMGILGLSLLGLAGGVAALALVSPFLLSAAAGIFLLGAATSSFGNTDLTPLAEQLAALGTAGPGLIAAGLGLTVLAGGLAALALVAPSLIIASAGLGLLAASSALLQDADFTNISQQLVQLGIAGPGLFTAASGLFAIAGGLTAFSLAMAASTTLGGLTSLFGTGPLTQLEALAAMSAPLSQVGVSLTAISAGLAGVAMALSTLDTAKIEELKDLVITTAFAAPMVAATGAITDLISGISGGSDDGESNQALIEEIRLLRAAVEQDRVTKVYMDSNELDMRIVQGRSGQ